MRTVLIVSPHFPPSGLASVHRARILAKHLPDAGWRPIIIRVREDRYGERPDPSLCELLPTDLEVVAADALPLGLTRPFGVGDVSLRATPFLGGVVSRAIVASKADVVFITGPPFYPMLMAGRIKERFGTPVVLDFQDPWVSDWGASRRAFSKPWAAHRLAAWLEPRAVRAAAYVTSVSEVQNAQFSERYPWFDRTRLAAVPIGGDPEDFLDAPAAKDSTSDKGGRTRLTYVGAYWPPMQPALRAFLRGLRRLRAESPALAERLDVHFVGTDPRLGDTAVSSVGPIAREEGVSDMVTEHAQRLPFREALATLAASDAVLLIGSDEPHYTASKIYPALMSGRPFFSLYHAACDAQPLLARAGGGIALGFDSASALAGIDEAIASGLRTLMTERGNLGRRDPDVFGPFTGRAIASQFGAIFDSVSGPT